MPRHPKPAWNQGLEALDATEEIKRVVAGRAKKVMVMLAALGLVPNAAAQPLDRLQRAVLDTPLESAVDRGETDTRSAQAAPQFPGGQGAVRLVKGSEDDLLLLRSLHGEMIVDSQLLSRRPSRVRAVVPGRRAAGPDFGFRRAGRTGTTRRQGSDSTNTV